MTEFYPGELRARIIKITVRQKTKLGELRAEGAGKQFTQPQNNRTIVGDVTNAGQLF